MHFSCPVSPGGILPSREKGEQLVKKMDHIRHTAVVPSSEEAPPLSPYRAFVVQFRTGMGAEVGCFVGRVEHMTSGQATRFDSVDGLVAFVAQILAVVHN
jgi:hypothetical protein